ncbi:MAG TPA: helix-turn-helix domain-containing protein [Solirubrobacteraceae bacterium]|jgi:AcrR family transcriptional regulator|nr:helix-turn-helix domain-containing protein [Solirubrobacteraceae bacterium]
MSVPTHDKPLRKDAARNREKVLAAAVGLFAERGTEGSLEEVAKRAGVGIGTLYRHFPTRDALVEAAYRNEVAQLRAAADELLAELPPDAALEAWMRRFVDYGTAKRGMRDALQSIAGGGADLFAETRGQVTDAVAVLLRAGAEAGTLRADVEPEDVLRAMGAIWLVAEGDDFAEQAMRILRLVLDGLRYRA